MSNTKVSLFSQILALVDRTTLIRIVKEYESDKHSKGNTTWTHLVCMLFMHFADATSYRDISNGLRSATGNLSHLGVGNAPCKSSISYMNKHRNYKVFRDLYLALLDKMEPSLFKRRQYAARLKRQIFIIDASVIPLCLSLFDWAKFRTHKGGIKLHAVLDYDSGLPSYAVITDAKQHDVKAAQSLVFPRGSVLVADRAYVDFEMLFNLDSCGVFFVTRLKSNAKIYIVETFKTNDKQEHILSDQDIKLLGVNTANKYPKNLRIVKVYHDKNDKVLVLLTNNMSWTADTISQLYKARWAVESFFRYLKQLFRVKTFIGTTENAVQIQMWTSLISILLLKYLKMKSSFKWHLSNLVTFIRINLYVKLDLYEWINNPLLNKPNPPPQLGLFQ